MFSTSFVHSRAHRNGGEKNFSESIQSSRMFIIAPLGSKYTAQVHVLYRGMAIEVKAITSLYII